MAECVGGVLTIAVPTTARIRDIVGVQGLRCSSCLGWNSRQPITRVVPCFRALVVNTLTRVSATTTLRVTERIGGVLTVPVPTTARIRDIVGVQGLLCSGCLGWNSWQAVTRFEWGFRALVVYTLTRFSATATFRMTEGVGGILTIPVPTTARIRDIVGVQGLLCSGCLGWNSWQAVTRVVWGFRALVVNTLASFSATTAFRMTKCVGGILAISIPTTAWIGDVLWVKINVSFLRLSNCLKAGRRDSNSEKNSDNQKTSMV